MTNDYLFVSIIIPCRNEEKFIGKCLDSLILQDYPKEKMEVLVVDGMSEDGTRKIIKEYSEKYPFIKLLDNAQKFTPFGLNVGIKKARGEFIVRMDAHADYPRDYVSKCLKYSKESGADNVGGPIKTLPAKSTIFAKSIAKVLSHPFGAAGSYFRTGSTKPRWVDTVFGGCYKREVFQKIGYFNEKLIRSQDIEFNKRLKKAGGKILLAPEISANYYPQTKLSDFFRHNFTDGIWTIYPLKFGIKFFSLRHLIPLFFVLGMLASSISGFFFWWGKAIFVLIFGVYLLLSLFFSLKSAIKEDPRYLFSLPLVFFSRHFGYGLGSLWGVVKILLP